MIANSKVKLRSKGLADAQQDYTWNRDPELARLDAAAPITMSLSQYTVCYARELSYPSLGRRPFAIETLDGKHIGNCSYYNISRIKREAELGIMIGDRDYWDKGYGIDAVSALLDYIFQRTNLKRIHLKTLDSNVRAQKCFGKCGFTSYGHINKDGHSFVLMEIHRKKWGELRTKA